MSLHERIGEYRDRVRTKALSHYDLGKWYRHVNPYWGEQAFCIYGHTIDGFWSHSSGGKHGTGHDGEKAHGEWLGENEEPIYLPCPWYMVAWLWFLGQTYGRFMPLPH